MVARHDHHRVVELSELAEGSDEPADPAVEVARIGVVAVAGVAGLGVGEADRVGLDAGAYATRVGVGRGEVERIRQVDLVVVVAVPPLRPGDVRIMGMDERCAEEEGPLVFVPGHVEQLARRRATDLFVVVDLVRGDRLAGLGQHVHVVVPLADPLTGPLPVRGPREVGRIDVGRQPFLEPVQLIGPDEVHLAGQHRAIPAARKVMGERRRRRRKLAGVVPRADRRDGTTRQHREARRRTQRRVTVGGIEAHATAGQRVEVWCRHHRMAVRTGELRGQLVGHDQHDVLHRASVNDGATPVKRSVRPLGSCARAVVRCTMASWLTISSVGVTL